MQHIDEEYIQKYHNKVENITALCIHNQLPWYCGNYPELEIGKTYHVTHIGVLRSSTKIMLEEFGLKEYNSACFELFENGNSIDNAYTQLQRFWAPYLKAMIKR